MAKLSWEDCRIRDGVRDTKILRDCFYEKFDVFAMESSRDYCQDAGRVFPRTQFGEINKCNERRAKSFEEIDSSQHRFYGKRFESEVYREFKATVPSFNGAIGKNPVLDWIDAVDDYFDQRNPPEDLKCNLAATKLKGEAHTWWEELQRHRFSKGKEMVSSWFKMSELLFLRFSHANCSMKVLTQFHSNGMKQLGERSSKDEFHYSDSSIADVLMVVECGNTLYDVTEHDTTIKQLQSYNPTDESCFLDHVTLDACKVLKWGDVLSDSGRNDAFTDMKETEADLITPHQLFSEIESAEIGTLEKLKPSSLSIEGGIEHNQLKVSVDPSILKTMILASLVNSLIGRHGLNISRFGSETSFATKVYNAKCDQFQRHIQLEPPDVDLLIGEMLTVSFDPGGNSTETLIVEGQWNEPNMLSSYDFIVKLCTSFSSLSTKMQHLNVGSHIGMVCTVPKIMPKLDIHLHGEQPERQIKLQALLMDSFGEIVYVTFDPGGIWEDGQNGDRQRRSKFLVCFAPNLWLIVNVYSYPFSIPAKHVYPSCHYRDFGVEAITEDVRIKDGVSSSSREDLIVDASGSRLIRVLKELWQPHVQSTHVKSLVIMAKYGSHVEVSFILQNELSDRPFLLLTGNTSILSLSPVIDVIFDGMDVVVGERGDVLVKYASKCINFGYQKLLATTIFKCAKVSYASIYKKNLELVRALLKENNAKTKVLVDSLEQSDRDFNGVSTLTQLKWGMCIATTHWPILTRCGSLFCKQNLTTCMEILSSQPPRSFLLHVTIIIIMEKNHFMGFQDYKGTQKMMLSWALCELFRRLPYLCYFMGMVLMFGFPRIDETKIEGDLSGFIGVGKQEPSTGSRMVGVGILTIGVGVDEQDSTNLGCAFPVVIRTKVPIGQKWTSPFSPAGPPKLLQHRQYLPLEMELQTYSLTGMLGNKFYITRGRVISLEGWNGENNTNMEWSFKMVKISVVIIDSSCVNVLSTNEQSRGFLKLFHTVVNGLDPPKNLDGACETSMWILKSSLVDELFEERDGDDVV